MSNTKWSLQDAKNKFSAVVDAAQAGKAQIVTRRGKPAVAIVSIEVFEKLQQWEARQLPAFMDHLLNMPQDDGEFQRQPIEPREFP
ncbi:MAG: prevent-host-death protein [Methylobacter sp.]|nr:MAG: prevent-host-death protein [Methylobacter sp.]PPD02759.1 MAG: prevent-host-death protein [Methylobacter sp.]PPD34155.1 MAG: prevent-host-death protein [Methylomonas sp.]